MSRQDRNILILGILIIVILVVGYYFLLLSPLRATYAERVQERSDKEAELQQVQQDVAELEAIRRNAPNIERQLLEFSKRIPTQPEVPTLVVQVEEIARLAGVTQISISPGAPAPPPGGGDFQVLPVTMTFEGTYEELQDFMLRLLDLSRLVTVNTVTYSEVEQQEGETTNVGAGIERELQVQVEAEVYFQPTGVPSGPEPVAPAPAEVTTPEETTTAGGGTTNAE
ncbi:MAG: type 4a pilus biogenesis protein PilO [Rubrobacter sp.]|nr:type 4a pilus biogenesis protein PilO [Rubrobacter sp.]